jgi:hypothetical protein
MIKENVQYDWKFCFNDGGNGHSLWLDRNTNRYTIKDRSGTKPHLTDDGVLWISDGFVNVHIHGDKLGTSFKVEKPRDRSTRGTCYCVFDFGIRVAKELNMEVVLSEELKKLEPLFCLTSSKGVSNELNR